MPRLQNKPNISISGLHLVDAEVRIWSGAFIKVYENKHETGKVDCIEKGAKRRSIGEAFGAKIQTDAVLVRGHGRGVINRMVGSLHRISTRKIHLNNKKKKCNSLFLFLCLLHNFYLNHKRIGFY